MSAAGGPDERSRELGPSAAALAADGAGFSFEAAAELAGLRVDLAIARAVPELSRSQARRLLEQERVRVDGKPARAAQRLRGGERVQGVAPLPEPLDVRAQAIVLDVVYEDGDLIVIDKPPEMVVHPAPGHAQGTLVHALLHHCRDLSGIGGVLRPGIVHRLDRGTSGLLVAAKNDAAHLALAEQFRAHSVRREYLALVRGSPRSKEGEVDAAIGRARSDRKRFTTRAPARARHALTRWRVEERLGEYTLLRVWPRTGRTHQIRVHLASTGLPVAGDPLYGGRAVGSELAGLQRQALHAAVLGFVHPREPRELLFERQPPPDMAAAHAALRAAPAATRAR